MKLSERAEEVLETLWGHAQGEKKGLLELGLDKGASEIEELTRLGYAKLANDKIALTDKGKAEGQKIVRRHRLAERLFTDVLDIKKKLVHPVSCQFEHLLQEGIEDNICILLGHPKTCPHGRPIPSGECCRKTNQAATKVISSLDNAAVNQKGRVAYIHTHDQKKLQKIMAMGVLPGMSISLIQKFPSYVFQVGHSQFAIDRELASAIYVLLTK
ncbi:MAG TPA: DtxR family iron (metal) dependent repressor [Candidatus Omnitrophica bacterium]|nr:DtxR family iron (metal) dependent repressor [Candidatus Omnitrophota bacterium]